MDSLRGNDESETEGQKESQKGLLSPEAEKVLRRNQGVKRKFGMVTVGGFFTPQLFTFKPNEMRLLREFGPGTTVEDAAKKAGVPIEIANRFLRRRAVREFLQDKFQQIALQDGWTVERWFAEGDKVWRGQKVVTREQLDIWKEFGSRILPKKTAGTESHEKPQITINIGAVDEAFRRQKAIEAEVVDNVGTGR